MQFALRFPVRSPCRMSGSLQFAIRSSLRSLPVSFSFLPVVTRVETGLRSVIVPCCFPWCAVTVELLSSRVINFRVTNCMHTIGDHLHIPPLHVTTCSWQRTFFGDHARRMMDKFHSSFLEIVVSHTLCPAPGSVISKALSVDTTLHHWQIVRCPHGGVHRSFGTALVLDYDRDMMDVLHS